MAATGGGHATMAWSTALTTSSCAVLQPWWSGGAVKTELSSPPTRCHRPLRALPRSAGLRLPRCDLHDAPPPPRLTRTASSASMVTSQRFAPAGSFSTSDASAMLPAWLVARQGQLCGRVLPRRVGPSPCSLSWPCPSSIVLEPCRPLRRFPTRRRVFARLAETLRRR